jgi:hypothetical protein
MLFVGSASAQNNIRPATRPITMPAATPGDMPAALRALRLSAVLMRVGITLLLLFLLNKLALCADRSRVQSALAESYKSRLYFTNPPFYDDLANLRAK